LKKRTNLFGTKIVGQKRCYFEKRTGEVVENTGKGYIGSQKRTGNEPKHEAEKLLKTLKGLKNEPETNRTEPELFTGLEDGAGASSPPIGRGTGRVVLIVLENNPDGFRNRRVLKLESLRRSLDRPGLHSGQTGSAGGAVFAMYAMNRDSPQRSYMPPGSACHSWARWDFAGA
jgi:hypothetical protein